MNNLNTKNCSGYYIGLMSGTSMDGIDAVLVEINGHGKDSVIRICENIEYSYPDKLKDKLLEIISTQKLNIREYSALNTYLGELFGEAVNLLLDKSSVKNKDIKAIGSHGQTLWHEPGGYKVNGINIRSTLQIAEPAEINVKTGIPVVSNFRAKDVALGGQGAPLIPLFDFVSFRSETKNIASLNVGGISNLTYLPKNSKIEDVLAFDTGPANILIDIVMKDKFERSYDKDGEIAKSAEVNIGLLELLMSNEYISKSIPKSTGREEFGGPFLSSIYDYCRANNISNEILVSTLTEFTVKSIYFNYEKFLAPKGAIEELIVCGGGTLNLEIMARLEKYFKNVEVVTCNKYGIDPKLKEGAAFAFYAMETLLGNSVNVPSATGAKSNSICGQITY